MKITRDTTIVVADGTKLLLFKVADTDPLRLTALPAPDVGSDNKHSGTHHTSSSANPDDSRLEEDSFGVGIVEWLNKQALENKFTEVAIVAPPKALGEMRKLYHKALSAMLVGELAKDLVNHPTDAIATALGG